MCIHPAYPSSQNGSKIMISLANSMVNKESVKYRLFSENVKLNFFTGCVIILRIKIAKIQICYNRSRVQTIA